MSHRFCFRGRTPAAGRFARYWQGAVWGWVVLVLAGCGTQQGPRRFAVEGKVSVGGQPLTSGVIRFIPTGGTQGPAAVAMIQEGTYKLSKHDGPVAGLQRVEIEASPSLGFAIDDEQAYVENIEKKRGGVVPPNPIHPGYHRDSTLSVEIVPERDNTFDFPLNPLGPMTVQR